MSKEGVAIVELLADKLCSVQGLRAFTLTEVCDSQGIASRSSGLFLYRSTPDAFRYLWEEEIEFYRNAPPSGTKVHNRVVCNGRLQRSRMGAMKAVEGLLDEKRTNCTLPTKYLALRLKRQKGLQIEESTGNEVTLSWMDKVDFGVGPLSPIHKLTFERKSGLMLKANTQVKGMRSETLFNYDLVI